MRRAARGRLITFEGGDGAGKTTQAGLLAARLERAGIAVRLTREPGGSPGGEAVRRLLLGEGRADWDAKGEALLMIAARRDHVERLIRPTLAAGGWVVCDRFADSTLAYQGYGRGLDLAELAAVSRFALADFHPDLTLVLDLPAELAEARATARHTRQDRFESEDRAFHDRLRRGYLEIARADPGRCVVIDGAGDRQEIHSAVLAAIEARLGLALRG